ncbi:MAG: cupin-like domain-containing protein [Massilia sp.]
MMQQQAIPEFADVDAATFHQEIVPLHRPVVMRGIVKHWPVVAQALRSTEAVCDYLKAFDTGADVNAIMTPPAAHGHVGYSAGLQGFSFVRNRLPLSAVITQLQRYLGSENAPSLAAQSALISESIPGFLDENRLPLLTPTIQPRIWLGNTITVPAHFDEAHNIACCVSGRRRFTLFPPEQVGNLYVGPLDFTPAGAPVSMATNDLAQFPRYREALAASMVAELAPGDAIYIPALWWHQVESIGTLNILINYWWGGAIGVTDRASSPSNCLLHCLANMQGLSPGVRAAWKAMFNHFVFDTDNAVAHIPSFRRGVLGELSEQDIRKLKDALIVQLQQ